MVQAQSVANQKQIIGKPKLANKRLSAVSKNQKSKSKNQYILVFVDVFTKWAKYYNLTRRPISYEIGEQILISEEALLN